MRHTIVALTRSALLAALILAAPAPSRAGEPEASWPHKPEHEEGPRAAPEDEAVEPSALADDPERARAAFLAWTDRQEALLARAFPDGHPEPAYRFSAELYGSVAGLVKERPGVVTPFIMGRTVLGRPIWAFRVRRPAEPVQKKILIFGGIHALEWIATEVSTDLLTWVILHPPRGVELVVVPIVNLDGRRLAEGDFVRGGERPYRRANAHHVDLNRDFEINRETEAIWKKIVPGFYYHSPAPLSQPESQALDRLGAEGFDAVVSLHAFGGFLYYPWSGDFSPPPDKATFEAMGQAMAAGQPRGQYTPKQLSHWGFFFRALGSELDHFYGKYGSYTFLIELTRSGIQPTRPSTWRDHFRWYNPVDPALGRAQGLGALRGLIGFVEEGRLPERPTPPRPPAPRP